MGECGLSPVCLAAQAQTRWLESSTRTYSRYSTLTPPDAHSLTLSCALLQQTLCWLLFAGMQGRIQTAEGLLQH